MALKVLPAALGAVYAKTAEEYLDSLESQGLPKTAMALRDYFRGPQVQGSGQSR